jgi:hypothetical protein
MKAILALILGVTVAVGTSCGGSGGTNDASGSKAERDIEANAQEHAESINLVLADLPEGWRASTDELDTAAQERFRSCLGSDYSGATIIGEANSKEFEHEDTAAASSSATVFESAEQAAHALTEAARGFESGSAEACFRSYVEDRLAEQNDVAVDDVDVGKLKVAAPEGVHETRAWQVAIKFSVPGLTTTGYFDLVLLRQSDSVADLNASDLVSPFDSDFRNALLQTLAGRLSATPADE